MNDEPREFVAFAEDVLWNAPEAKALLKQTEEKRRLSLMFSRMRTASQLSQKDIAERTGWDKSYISKLESALEERVPSLRTLARYAEACGMTIGIVVASQGSDAYNDVDVIDAFPLAPETATVPRERRRELLDFGELRGRKISLTLRRIPSLDIRD